MLAGAREQACVRVCKRVCVHKCACECRVSRQNADGGRPKQLASFPSGSKCTISIRAPKKKQKEKRKSPAPFPSF